MKNDDDKETPPPLPVFVNHNAKPQPTKKKASSMNYLFIPVVICGCLLWIAYSQFQSNSSSNKGPTSNTDFPRAKHRNTWMHDLQETLPPFANGYRFEKHVRKYNFTVCQIPGNFMEITAAITCFLSDPALYDNNNQTISTDLEEDGLCGTNPPLTIWRREDYKKLEKAKPRKIAFVQHPIERFARTFNHECIGEDKNCLNCKGNLKCFLVKLYKAHLPVAEGLAGRIRNDITTKFSPQSWNCQMLHYFNSIEFIDIGGNPKQKEEFNQEFDKVLIEQGVNRRSRVIIRDEIEKIPMQLSDKEKQIMKAIRKEKDLIRLFRNLYEHDFILFGFKP